MRPGACPQTEEDDDDGDNDEDEDEDDENGSDDDGTEDDSEDEGSPAQEGEESRSVSASQQAPAAGASQLLQTAPSQAPQRDSHPPAESLFGLGPLGSIQGADLGNLCRPGIRTDIRDILQGARLTPARALLLPSRAESAGLGISAQAFRIYMWAETYTWKVQTMKHTCLRADMSLPQDLDDDEPICQRTRTRMPMNHVSLDELDALLGNEDEGLFDEEGEQYQHFLRVSLSPYSQP